MSIIIKEILEKLQSLTLLEVAELVSQIEETFGVDASVPFAGNFIAAPIDLSSQKKIEVIEEQTSFDVILEEVPNDKRIPILKVVRNLARLELREAKEAISNLPKTIKRSVTKDEAENAKQQLEEVGAKIKIK